MDFRLEVVHADHDAWPREGVRVVQLTPPGYAAHAIGTGLSGMKPGPWKACSSRSR